MAAVRFEESPLAGHGRGLAATTAAPMLPPCGPPAADPVSTSAVAVLSAHAQALASVIEHADAVRAHGGAAVAATAATLGGIDRANAAAISSVTGGPPPADIRASTTPSPSPPAPHVPPVPPPPPAAPLLPGEQWSTLIHGGPGSAGIRGFADALRTRARTLEDTAGRVTGHGRGIDEHWIDGAQRAGANTTRHGRWLNNAAQQANTIAAAADRIADGFDATRSAVPTPAEYTAARQDILAAQAAADPIRLSRAVEHYTALNTQTLDAVVAGYHPGTTGTLTGLPQPLPAAPPITHDGVQPLDSRLGDLPQAPPPTPPYPVNDVIAEATDLDGNHIVMRRGYYDAVTRKGFGWDKIYWRHGVVNPGVFSDLISHSRPIADEGGTLIYEVPINKTHCTSGFLGLPDCEDTGESLTMRIVVNTNPSIDVPGGGQKGLITMYPKAGGSGVIEIGPNWTWTPPWVNNYAPIN